MKNRGYIVPDPIDPEEDICVRVFIPNHQLYIAAFMRAYVYFGEWVAWERDPTGKAKLAAEVWRRAIDRTQEEFDCAKGDCGIMDIRQKTGAPCIIEKQAGCDGDWENAVDMKLCAPKMRLHGGVIQQDTTGNGDWVDTVDPETEAFDPRFDEPAPAPWPDPPPGESGQCLSAANVAHFLGWASYQIAYHMESGLILAQLYGAIATVVSAVIKFVPATRLLLAILEIYNMAIDDWTEVKETETIVRLEEILVCKFGADGSMSKSTWETVLHDIAIEQSTHANSNQRAKWGLVYVLVDMFGSSGMTALGKVWGITTYECTYDECSDWEHVWDFRTSQGGFTLGGSGGGGEWISGTGWVSTPHGTGHAISIFNEFIENAAACKHARVYISYSTGLVNRWDRLMGDDEEIALWENVEYPPKPELSWEYWVGEISDVRKINLNPSRPGNGQIIIQQLAISGTGNDPFGTESEI